MKTLRTDLTAFSLTGLIVVAAVVLVALGHEVPAFLVDLGLISAGVGGGAALPNGASTSAPKTSSSPAALVDQVADVVPAPAAAPVVESLVSAPAVTPPAATPGRDWTETIPAITPAMIAADKAAQA